MIVYGFINSIILALIALGFSITFGISRVANFAHGAFYVFGGVVTWFFLMKMGLPYVLSAIMAVLIVGIVGGLMYRLLLVRLRGLELSEVITTFAVGIIILELMRSAGIMGFEYRLPSFIPGSTEILGTYVGYQRIFIVITGLLLLAILYLFVHHTKLGLSFRGVAQEDHTALSLGINPDRISMLSVTMGSMICTIAAIVILPLGTISVDEGYDILLKSLAVCIIGGLESATGVIVASFIIGYAEVLTSMYISSTLTMVVPLACMLLILLIRPSGLFGKHKELEERI
ncbi:MAG: branched-chain amino acid ABC transporter permease [Deltaproteobacteria bacterium]|nr:branched-chain amino acid ABC transporter permease [Deltaproteobacteria bacterium]MBW1927527.1 branched-chain amino acid ABC transporter permease [Deltaproteobacteria bacterium]MBW2125188.1 branched-chain amino acid ABC transporter permease [Deltaproteobacteria bacterium]RLB16080.1 MAG: branched-chain amino acid ABC transporter permease [Deltaproteobacteria bacterium]